MISNKWSRRIIVLSLAGFLMVGCAVNKRDNSSDDEEDTETTVRQNPILPTPPGSYINPADRSAYILNHLWDDYSVIDTTSFADSNDATEQFLVNILGLANYAGPTTFGVSMNTMLTKSTPVVRDRVIEIMDRYLYDPNSPMRNEDLYATFMKAALESNSASFADSIRYEDRLTMYYKNKPGTKSQDFDFTTIDGRKMTLHALKAKHLMLFFYNPDCHTCQAMEAYIKDSPLFKNALDRQELKILFLYPDMNVEEWKAKAPDMPQPSIVAYNPSQSINNKRLYEIKAMPCLYLLAQDKTVIMRDVSMQQIESYVYNLLNL